MSQPVKLGIVGLGRWAKVLTRAVQKSDRLKIVAAYSRSEERRAAFEKELGVPGVPDMKESHLTVAGLSRKDPAPGFSS